MPFNQRIFIEGVPSESTVSDLFVQQALDDAAIYGYAPPTKRWAAATSSLIRRRWLGAPCCSCRQRRHLRHGRGGSGGSQARHRAVRPHVGNPNRVWHLLPRQAEHRRHAGLPKVEFEETSTHQETTVSAEDDLRSWDYNERLNVDGQGILLRAGVNWRVTSQLRLDSPTKPGPHDPAGQLQHLVVHPMGGRQRTRRLQPRHQQRIPDVHPRRTTVSASFLMGKLGVLAADYVHTDLREGELGDPGTILSSGTITRRRMWPWTAACKSSVKPGWAWSFAWSLERIPHPDGWRHREFPFNPNGVATDGSRHHASLAPNTASATCTSAWHGAAPGTRKTTCSWGPSIPRAVARSTALPQP